MKVLDTLKPFCPEVRLFHSRKKCEEWCIRRFGFPPRFIDGVDAQTTYWDGVAIVLFEVSDDPIWENALLVHESYHIVCNHLEELAEKDAGEEIVAYMMQCVSGSLMAAHEKWRERHVRQEG